MRHNASVKESEGVFLLKQLSNGFILRSLSEGYVSDKTDLPNFYVDVFSEEQGLQEAVLGPWTEDLISGQHPTVTLDDVWVVVDPAQKDRIISALLLIPQVWHYEEITFSVGRVELVATHKDYRRQGLIRELMNVAHERSAKLGHKVQAITGIPHYYRQFGYSMTISLGVGATLPITAIPDLKADQEPQYTLHPATVDDIPLLSAFYNGEILKSLVSVERTSERWHYDLSLRRPKTPPSVNYLLIQNKNGLPIGYVGIGDIAWGKRLACLEYVVGDQSSYLATFEDVMRGLKAFAKEKYPDDEQPHSIAFDTGMDRAIKTMVDKTYPGLMHRREYAWYIRIPDLRQFIYELKPVLERRLIGSGAHRFTGELAINFHDKSGLVLKFENGCLIESSKLPFGYDTDAAFPWQLFLTLVFGYRTTEELTRLLPDVFTNRKAEVLLNILFPPKRSWVMGIY